MDCLFCRIISGEIPSKKLYEDENLLAFYDINPQAPVHFLVIPKTHMKSLDAINEENMVYVSAILRKIPELAKLAGLNNGYRIISNCGADACQSVPHLHFHVLGGEKLSERMA